MDHWAAISELVSEAWFLVMEEARNNPAPRAKVFEQGVKLVRKAWSVHQIWKKKRDINEPSARTFDIVDQLLVALGGLYVSGKASQIVERFRTPGAGSEGRVHPGAPETP